MNETSWVPLLLYTLKPSIGNEHPLTKRFQTFQKTFRTCDWQSGAFKQLFCSGRIMKEEDWSKAQNHASIYPAWGLASGSLCSSFCINDAWEFWYVSIEIIWKAFKLRTSALLYMEKFVKAECYVLEMFSIDIGKFHNFHCVADINWSNALEKNRTISMIKALKRSMRSTN